MDRHFCNYYLFNNMGQCNGVLLELGLKESADLIEERAQIVAKEQGDEWEWGSLFGAYMCLGANKSDSEMKEWARSCNKWLTDDWRKWESDNCVR